MGTGLKFLFEEEVAMNQGTILGSQIGKWIILVALVAVLAALLTASVVRADRRTACWHHRVRRERHRPGGHFHGHGPRGRHVITGRN